eukprot:UN22205
MQIIYLILVKVESSKRCDTISLVHRGSRHYIHNCILLRDFTVGNKLRKLQ